MWKRDSGSTFKERKKERKENNFAILTRIFFKRERERDSCIERNIDRVSNILLFFLFRWKNNITKHFACVIRYLMLYKPIYIREMKNLEEVMKRLKEKEKYYFIRFDLISRKISRYNRRDICGGEKPVLISITKRNEIQMARYALSDRLKFHGGKRNFPSTLDRCTGESLKSELLKAVYSRGCQ